jgi:hypothetical protein
LTDNLLIVGIAGQMQSGKDTVAQMLIECGERANIAVVRRALADALKEEVADFLKDYVLGSERQMWLERMHGPSRPEKEQLRKLMQWWGTEFKRQMFTDDYWLARLYQWIEDRYSWTASGTKKWNPDAKRILVVPDVRFINECQWVRDSSRGYLIRIERPDVANTEDHPSENDFQNWTSWNAAILNGDGLEELQRIVGHTFHGMIDWKWGACAT